MTTHAPRIYVLDRICKQIETTLRMADGVEKFERLADLHEQEADFWQRRFESSNRRLDWLACAAATERARALSQQWAKRAGHKAHSAGSRPIDNTTCQAVPA
jgi:hypothetical protein